MAVPRQAVDEGGAAAGRRTRPRPRPQPTAADDVVAFADAIGFPLILKPRSGAGAQGTVRVDSMAELDRALGGFGGASSIAVEEFVEGHEGFYDTITIDGHVVHDWVTHYYPNVLEAMRHRWISPQFITTNRIDDSPFYDEVREMGQRVIEALGIPTSATHMEWFYGPKGLRFSEIGCRPPGVGAWDLYSAANDVDVYREWAHAIVHGGPENADVAASTPPASSRCVPSRTATSTATAGSTTSTPATASGSSTPTCPTPAPPTQPVEAGYMANA